MNADQVKLLNSEFLKDNGKGKPVAKSVYYDLDNNTSLRNSNDFVFFDEGNKLIHAIIANRNNNVKDEAPFTLISADYSMIQFVEANFDMGGLVSILESKIGAPLNENQKKAIKLWAQNLPVHHRNPNVGLDYYKTGPDDSKIDQKLITGDEDKTEKGQHDPINFGKPNDHSDIGLKNAMKKFLASVSNPSITELKYTDSSIDAVISSTENLNIGFTDFIDSLKSVKEAVFTVGGSSVKMVTSNTSSYDTFKQGVINLMPNTENQTVNGSLTMETNNGKKVVYTLNVKYYNKAEENVTVNGKVYSSLNKAFEEIGSEPVTVTLKNDLTEDVVVPEGSDVTIDLAGKKITNKASDSTIVNKGKLVISGTGTIDNTIHGKAPVKNDIGGEITILGGTITRSTEEGKTNSFYAIQNMGKLVIGEAGGDNSNININLNGDYSSMICNEIDSDRYTVPDDTVCEVVINGGMFNGGLNTVKNGEYSKLTINDGTFINTAQATVLNWGECEINGGSFTAPDLCNVTTGKFNAHTKGITVIKGGTFDVGTSACLESNKSYPAESISVYGGTFSSDPAQYVAEGYKSVSADGKFNVVEKTAEDKVDAIIENVSGLEITEDTSAENSYSIVTSNGKISESGLFDQLAGLDGLKTITVSNGSESAVYTTDGSLDEFKTAVDALCPKDNDAAQVTLTMTVEFN